MQTIIGFLEWAGNLQTGWGFIATPARWLLRRLQNQRSGAMTGGGIEFFPDRPSLEHAHKTLGARLGGANSACGIFVVGQKFFGARSNVHVMRKLLLPHPDSDALKYYSRVSGHDEVPQYIRDATRHALEAGTRVRWYQPFVFSSLLLVDTDKPTGWVHIEIVLPYSQPEERPSFTIYKRQSEITVTRFQHIFDEIWDSPETITPPSEHPGGNTDGAR